LTEVASRIVQSRKEKPKKIVEVEQSEEQDPRVSSFSKKNHIKKIESTNHSIDKKEKLICKADDNKQQKLRDNDLTHQCRLD